MALATNVSVLSHLDLEEIGTKTHNDLETDIDTNETDISTNTGNITSNTNQASVIEGRLDDQDILITTNTGNISDNTDDISTNTGNISTNTGNISTNTGNISTNSSDINTNAGNISTNTGNISTNTGNISTNTGNIATKVSSNLFDANSILKADSDNTPVVLSVPTNTVIGRSTGNISALTVPTIKEMLGFGDNFYHGASESESTTTSNSFQTKLTLSIPITLGSYVYRIGWYCECQFLNAYNDFQGRIYLNDTTIISERRQESRDAGTHQWEIYSGSYITGLSGSGNFIRLQWCGSTSASASVRRARLEFWRVS